MEWEGREESENVEDRRGATTPTKFALGGAAGIVVVLISYFLGFDIRPLLQMFGAGQQQQQEQNDDNRPKDPAEERAAHFTKIIFGDTERVWGELFQRMGKTYKKPTLVLFTDQVTSACGQADAAVGPFYCPGDEKVYIDLSFYKLMQERLKAPGDFAHAYVIAHEVGHHVQNLLGYSEKAERVMRGGDKREANHMSVRLELQADYFAGVWAHYGEEKYKFIQPGDVEAAMNAANQIGDDKLQREARGRVVPDSFTHGTSAQRKRWFDLGLKTGDIDGAKKLFDLKYEDL